MRSIKERKQFLYARAEMLGLAIRTYTPDQTTVYKFFDKTAENMDTLDYFSGNGMGRGHGLGDAEQWLDGYAQAMFRWVK